MSLFHRCLTGAVAVASITSAGCFAELRGGATRATETPAGGGEATTGLGWRLGFYLGFYIDPGPTRTLAAVSWPAYNFHFVGKSAGPIGGFKDRDPELRIDVGLGRPRVLDIHKRITLAGTYGTSGKVLMRDGEEAMGVSSTQKALFAGLTFDWRLSPGYVLSEGIGFTIGPSYTSWETDTMGSMTSVGLEVRIHAAITPLSYLMGSRSLCGDDGSKCKSFMSDYEPTRIEQGPAAPVEHCSDVPGPNGTTVRRCTTR